MRYDAEESARHEPDGGHGADLGERNGLLQTPLTLTQTRHVETTKIIDAAS